MPEYGTASRSVKSWTVACLRDVGSEAAATRYRRLKRQLRCLEDSCRRRSFTEASPQVPGWSRLSCRLRERIGVEAAGQRRTICSVAATRQVP
ncbi:hypothetical protein [Streptomyces sp. NPDC058385]|uniref:hypothetical protein n=1 Tax=Streptomyces sp. NPDC058385 TaxID=3346473 RepID=UPI0036479C57